MKNIKYYKVLIFSVFALISNLSFAEAERIEPGWLGFNSVVVSSPEAAKQTLIPNIELYNPQYPCYLSDWIFSLTKVDTYRNTATWVGARTSQTCIHSGNFSYQASCQAAHTGGIRSLSIKGDGNSAWCECPADYYLGQASNQCRPMCNEGSYLSLAKGGCSPLTPCSTYPCTGPYTADPDLGAPDVCSGNPINTAMGNKYQIENDIASRKGLRFDRYYNSYDSRNVGIGGGWRHSFVRKIVPVYQTHFNPPPRNDIDPDWIVKLVGETVAYYLAERDDGKSFAFSLSGAAMGAPMKEGFSMRISPDGFELSNGTQVERYNGKGALLSVEDGNYLKTTIQYGSDGKIFQVSNDRGEVLVFQYLRGRLGSIDKDGEAVNFEYNSLGGLAKVLYADGSSRRYTYGTGRQSFLLKSLIDESGTVFAAWTYDGQLRAISSEHAQGVGRVTLTYGVDGTLRWTDEKDPLGTTRRYTFKTMVGASLPVGNSQPGGAGCNAANSALTYDANGNVSTRSDFNGISTTYVYDLSRNLETSRTEAAGTPQARTIATTWHPTLRLPASITEPGRSTTFTYDANGNL
ncbi:DUF6531 domain-containing protein, partial [Chitiniphilus eburneus]